MGCIRSKIYSEVNENLGLSRGRPCMAEFSDMTLSHGHWTEHEPNDPAVAESGIVSLYHCGGGDRADGKDVSTNFESQERLPYHGELLCILYHTACVKTSFRHLLSLRPHDLFNVP